ncbi:MAG: class I SAM-dependent methyltransferase [Bacteroidota bacterium]
MKSKYDKIGVGYNATRKADPFLAKRFLEHLAPNKNGRYLDIGCGTGNYTIEFQKKGFDFIGIDPSQLMLEKARSKSRLVDWRIGSAEKTDLPNEYVEGIIASLTLHHWSDLGKGFIELYRVLKPNGRIVIFTSTPKQMRGYWLNHYFPKMLADSIMQMPSLEIIEDAMAESGFKIKGRETYAIHAGLQDNFLYCGKHRAELYFDPQIRKGISSFSSLANRSEVEKGLIELRQDIDSGKIEEVMKNYEHDFGDYVYVLGKKPAA